MELSWGGLGVILAKLGRLGGSFWHHFGGLGGSWAPSGSQTRLGRRLGRFLVDFRGQHGSNLAPQMEPKSIKNRCQNGSKF